MKSINPYEPPGNSMIMLKDKKKTQSFYNPLEMLIDLTIPGAAIYNGFQWDRAIASQNNIKFDYQFGKNLPGYIALEAIKLICITSTPLISESLNLF